MAKAFRDDCAIRINNRVQLQRPGVVEPTLNSRISGESSFDNALALGNVLLTRRSVKMSLRCGNESRQVLIDVIPQRVQIDFGNTRATDMSVCTVRLHFDCVDSVRFAIAIGQCARLNIRVCHHRVRSGNVWGLHLDDRVHVLRDALSKLIVCKEFRELGSAWLVLKPNEPMEVETATIVGFRVELIAIHAAKNARLVVTDRCPAEKCTYERVEMMWLNCTAAKGFCDTINLRCLASSAKQSMKMKLLTDVGKDLQELTPDLMGNSCKKPSENTHL